VKGVGQVTVGGSSSPAVRVELNPTLLNAMESASSRAPGDCRLQCQPTEGDVEEGDRHWQIYANDQAQKARDYIR